MVVVVPSPPAISPDVVSLFYVVDELLARSPVLIFYGPSATHTAAANNSRIQAHIFSPAGLQSYPRLTISPSSHLYAAVNCLPREEQGDEICRGLAFSLYKYFAELPAPVKQAWENQPTALGSLRSAPTLFSEHHAAILASRMVKVENVAEVIQNIRAALAEQSVSWLDMDVVLPPGSMHEMNMGSRDSILPDMSDEELDNQRFGAYAPLVKLFGEPAFLPTSRLRRRPSKPTALNRSTRFTKKSKEKIRQELNELLSTEENYVDKLYDLVHGVAEDFREKARTKRESSASPDEKTLQGLFPSSLDEILVINSDFLEALKKIVEETQEAAINDLESTPEQGTAIPMAPTRADVTGALAVATCLRSWFPKFANCYTDYTKAHSQMSAHLRRFMNTQSSFSNRMQETGEQRLMSMLIEPVQRLPRYNLYIDNILKQLPAGHPALNSLLKARDTITNICSHDAHTVQPSQMLEILQSLVTSWPQAFQPRGRLISAYDITELPPPYRTDAHGSRTMFGVLLLFTDFLVVLRKGSKQATSARGLMAQLDGTDVTITDSKSGDLVFRQALELSSFDLTEMDGGRLLQLLPLQETRQPTGPRRPGSSRPGSLAGESTVQVFQPTGSVEGKASRIIEELVRARVEGRFCETERESHKWEVRSATSTDLNIFLAMFEQSQGEKREGRGPPAKIRIVVDPTKGADVIRAGRYGVEVAATLTLGGNGLYRLEMDGINDFSSRDTLTAGEFLPVLTKRLNNLLQMRSQIRNPALAAILLLRNQHILQTLRIITEDACSRDEVATKERASRPHSPVKMLTNLFNQSVSRDNGSLRRKNTVSTLFDDIPPLHHHKANASKTSLESFGSGSIALDAPTELVHAAADALSKLEETLASYVLGLCHRKGNIVGKVLRSRQFADELAVNELYNALLEDPSNVEIMGQSPVDVLFAAFEKFIKIAWFDKIGPIISLATWNAIQSQLDSENPGDFEEFFRSCFGDMSPQNQRALKACVKLLEDLLGGTSNDGDRGIMTASFAEVLGPEGHTHEFVSVLDRLVEDVQALLCEPTPSATPQGSFSDGSRTRATNTGSLTSNTSLRKKFGLGGLTRKGSKTEESEKPDLGSSVWRALSKSKDEKAVSLSRAFASQIQRANSTDAVTRLSPKRPNSRDRPTVLGAFPFENSPLASIVETNTPAGPPRKKRRSSLSDLRPLPPSVANTPTCNTPRRGHADSIRVSESPRTPSYVKQSFIPQPSSNNHTPTRREDSPIRVVPPRPLSIGKNRLSSTRADEVTITANSPRPRTRKVSQSVSNIPLMKSSLGPGGLTERPISGNVRKLPSGSGFGDKPSLGAAFSPSTPTRRLRMQSPQKLRERLLNEQRTVEREDVALQAELGKIGFEMRALNRGASNAESEAIASLEAKIQSITSNHTSLVSTLTSRIDSLANDLSTTLQISESRVKKLDELYREANAENEALYARFNDEIQKVVKGVRSGQGEAEVMSRMKGAEEESARLRKENSRLKREVAGLRAQMRD
ncbi:hypothetical protein EG328_006593 [Venturia inaequalis]|uniref:DH domain-containing protein n=1 Tax=Venturia inaequalis TaxID=5025 RepID=A0A8H3VNW0_VENIN|nr:hypothetical protein EG328_006593 [Venturia inaequalis]KAE9992654.1 hypothetical protein EG327_008255 [Venturia inaequalis]RDI78057.1 hypothetical protein Vi05172_g11949 [Venturia inaequalis]